MIASASRMMRDTSSAQVQGLIHDIPTCAELVSRIMRDAEAIIQSRLDAMLSGAQRQAAE